ncbi:MAG: PAS domain-containing protein, partial [Polyangiaceae bacterium]|nr:PAS domain-containing protein [Polyangiaceae bacterium]
MTSRSTEPFGLEARERLLAGAEQIAHLGSFAWDMPSDTSHWSDELYRILGYDVGELPASREAFYAAIHPSDRAR